MKTSTPFILKAALLLAACYGLSVQKSHAVICITAPPAPLTLAVPPSYMGFTNITLSAINRTSTDDELWADVNTTNQSTRLTQSTAYTLTFTHDDLWNVLVRAWIDYNNDGDFLDAGELLGTSALSPGMGTPYTGTINFNASASATGWKNMRVTVDLDDGSMSLGAPVSNNCWYGEVEDYQVNLATSAAMSYTSCTTTQGNTSVVYQNTTDQQVIGVEIVTGTGGASPLTATSFTFQTNGTTSISDISNAKLWTTSSSCNFAAVTQLGGTVASPPASGTPFTISGFTFTLAPGTNYFWLTYDISPTAVSGNVIDAQCTALTAGGSPRTPATTSPAGSRPISDGFTSAVTTQPNTGVVGVSMANQLVVGVEVTIASQTLTATSFTFNTTGSTNALTDIASASLWYTGTNMTFNTATQFGSIVSSPNGSFSFTGSTALAPGTYYFWLTYTISGSATVGDKVDAQCTSLTVSGLAHTPAPTSPAGDRTIVATANIPLQYQATFGTTADEDGICFDLTSDGGYIINARYQSDCMACPNMEQGWLIKTDASAAILWSSIFGGGHSEEGRWIKTTTDGYIVAGETNSNAPIQFDMNFAKFNSAGTMQWNKSVGSTSTAEGYMDIYTPSSGMVTSDGGFVFCCEGSISGFNKDFYVVKMTAAGTFEWGTTIGGTSMELANSVQQTTEGGYIVAGSGYIGSTNQGAYLVKLNSAGTFQWGKSYDYTSSGTPAARAHDIRQTSDGGFIVVGSSSNGSADWDMLLMKTNSAGTVQWYKCYGTSNNEWGLSFAATVDGGYILSGYGNSTNYWGIYNDGLLVKVDGTGGLQWAKAYGGAQEDQAIKVMQTTDGGYAFTGYTKSFGAGAEDVWFGKTNEVGETGANACNFQSLSFAVSSGGTTVTGGSGAARGAITTNTIVAGSLSVTPNIVCQIVLPIELLDFSASLLPDNQVKCNWTTGTETYNDYFVVEHSVDARSFAPIGSVRGAGNSNVNQYYSFKDEHPSPGINYYRLRQVDFDGQYTYTQVVSVEISRFPYVVVIFPNPVQKQLNCVISADQNTAITASVIDMLGNTVAGERRKLSRGKNNLAFDIATLPQGVYLFLVSDGVKQQQLKFVKE